MPYGVLDGTKQQKKETYQLLPRKKTPEEENGEVKILRLSPDVDISKPNVKAQTGRFLMGLTFFFSQKVPHVLTFL